IFVDRVSFLLERIVLAAKLRKGQHLENTQLCNYVVMIHFHDIYHILCQGWRCSSVGRILAQLARSSGSICIALSKLHTVVHPCLASALRRGKQEDQKFKIIFYYITSSRPAWAT
ncbi:mCG145098, partial [Mus musculus]